MARLETPRQNHCLSALIAFEANSCCFSFRSCMSESCAKDATVFDSAYTT